MHHEFWFERWQTGQIGFHEGKPNALLAAYHSRLVDAGGGRGRVLVPLCGKTVDLGFLAGLGFDVTGVELVPSAAEAFFSEQGITAAEEQWHRFRSLRGAGVRIAVGSIFDVALPPSERFDAAYDRAALVALRPEDRERYVATLLDALRPGARLLLVTFHFEGVAQSGPPFSVPEGEVHRLFSACGREKLFEKDILETEARFRERGATRVLEQAWLVTAPS